MKSLILTSAIIFLFSLNASVYKYKLEFIGEGASDHSVVFEIDDNGNINEIENKKYYEIDKQYFFGELKLTIRRRFQKEGYVGLYVIKNQQVSMGCAAYVSPEGYYGIQANQSKLMVYDKTFNRYVSLLENDMVKASEEACLDEILGDMDRL